MRPSENKYDMRKTVALILVAVLTNASTQEAQNAGVNWAEMKNFHHFMSTTFHPSEEGNLTPVKEKADSMYIAAKQWQASAIPANFKPEETKKALGELVAKCQEIKTSVAKQAGDEQLKKQLAEGHDIFHKIVKECRKEDEKH